MNSTGSLTSKGLEGGIYGIIDEDELGLFKFTFKQRDIKIAATSLAKKFSSSSAPSQIKTPKKGSLSQRLNLQKMPRNLPKIIKILVLS